MIWNLAQQLKGAKRRNLRMLALLRRVLYNTPAESSLMLEAKEVNEPNKMGKF
jgi:hypothetical protein